MTSKRFASARGAARARRVVSAAALVAAGALVARHAGAYVLEGQQWADQNTATPNTIDIYYDFRNIVVGNTTYHNDLTDNTAVAATQRALMVETLNNWSASTGNKIVFTQQTSGNNVINLGLGDLAAVGGSSGRTGVLGLGGGSYSVPGNKYVSGFAWLNDSYTFDTTIGNGNPPTPPGPDADFYTIALHEVGHSIGLGHSESSPANVMTAVDEGEKLGPSQDDINGVHAIYGTTHTANPAVDYTAVARTIPSFTLAYGGNYNYFGSGTATEYRYYTDAEGVTVSGATKITYGGLEQSGGAWAHSSIVIADTFGYNGSPYVALSGGTMTVSGAVTVGQADAGAFTVSGGNATVGSLAAGVANNNAAVTVSGGSLAVSGAMTLSAHAALNVSGGLLSAASTVNSGTVSQTGGTTTLGPLSGTGSLSVGGGTGTAVMTVTRFAQNAVSLGTGGTLAVAAAVPRVTNTASALTISGSGSLDLANHDLTVNGTNAATIRTYLANGYNGGTWDGAGGIRSSVAAGDSNRAHALGYSSDPANGAPAGKTLIRYTLAGDATIDGTVDIADFGKLSVNFGKSGIGWDGGDFTYDGTVDIADFGKLSVNFGKNVSTSPAGGASAAATPTLTAAGSAHASAGAGAASVTVDKGTGDVRVTFANIASRGFEIDSAAGQLNAADGGAAAAGAWTLLGRSGTLLGEGYDLATDPQATAPTLLNETEDLGALYANLGSAGDLTFRYLDANGDVQAAAVAYTGVPEPTGLSVLAGLGAVRLLLRRRRASLRDGG